MPAFTFGLAAGDPAANAFTASTLPFISANDLTNAGTLYAFVADNPNVNDYGDFPVANGASGHFVTVPDMIASGKRADGKDVRASDFGYTAPPAVSR